MKNLIVNWNNIRISEKNQEIYISLTDMAKNFWEPNILISSWIKRKDTIEYLWIWETIHNKDFKPQEFLGFKNSAWTNRFNLSTTQWAEKTKAIWIKATSWRYWGTFATEDIAIHFWQWLSPEFSLYLIKEFKRFKQLEAEQDSKNWQLVRTLSKINYSIHTDAINLYLIPKKISNKSKWPYFTKEADL